MLNASVVVIPLERYEELIRTETRVDTVVERIMHGGFVNKEDILWMLNTELSVELALEIREKTQKDIMKLNENHNDLEG